MLWPKPACALSWRRTSGGVAALAPEAALYLSTAKRPVAQAWPRQNTERKEQFPLRSRNCPKPTPALSQKVAKGWLTGPGVATRYAAPRRGRKVGGAGGSRFGLWHCWIGKRNAGGGVLAMVLRNCLDADELCGLL